MRNMMISFNWVLLLSIFFVMCSQCTHRMGTRYCVKGGCYRGYGEARVDYFGQSKIRDGFVGYAIWKGEFYDSSLNGRGTFEQHHTSIEGETYEGEFVNYEFHGKGKWEFLPTSPWPREELESCPWKYEGEFKNGEPDGKGVLTTRPGKTYAGTFSNGWICYEGNCENGKGSMLNWRGSHYVGDLKNGRRHGQGVGYDSSNYRKYTGGFKDGRYEGYGVEVGYDTAQYKDGKWHEPRAYVRYEGMHVDGKYNGYGKLIFPNDGPNGADRVQEGEWDGHHNCTGPKCNGALKAPPPDFLEKMREKAEGESNK
ncbi:hypothetical protein EHQ52_17135 [Leptospira koniambonensis]|uniref:Membrane-binding protein n=1 Tax=Leptospira koniambonensis TaxID=2484950 RepID=A0A4R9J2T3_9LEPT|nr:hypothetical protein [Leptospira koniambonensis]TGL30060.1 hypothetical protein EHQ52_17135 [Leptospira koniambonensis]